MRGLGFRWRSKSLPIEAKERDCCVFSVLGDEREREGSVPYAGVKENSRIECYEAE